MAVTTLDSGAITDLAIGKRWRRGIALDSIDAATSSTTTYYYRTPDGIRGNTTDTNNIPANSIVERIA